MNKKPICSSKHHPSYLYTLPTPFPHNFYIIFMENQNNAFVMSTPCLNHFDATSTLSRRNFNRRRQVSTPFRHCPDSTPFRHHFDTFRHHFDTISTPFRHHFDTFRHHFDTISTWSDTHAAAHVSHALSAAIEGRKAIHSPF